MQVFQDVISTDYTITTESKCRNAKYTSHKRYSIVYSSFIDGFVPWSTAYEA